MDQINYWDAQAATFDEEPDHGLSDPLVRNAWRDLLVPLMPPVPARIADVGCGTGTLAVLLAEAGYAVTGIDTAPRMVHSARHKAAAAGVGAEFCIGDASRPPLLASSVDVVLVRHVLWALPDPVRAIGEWVRLLTSTGRLVFIEGRWSTGGGLSANALGQMVLRHRSQATVTALNDPRLWRREIDDERYLLVSTN